MMRAFVCVIECSKESMLYLEWDGFVAVLESWTSVMKAEADLKPTLVSGNTRAYLCMGCMNVYMLLVYTHVHLPEKNIPGGARQAI